MRIVDDDVSWSSIAAVQEKEEEEDEADMPVVAEFIDERPDEVKLMEEFRTNAKWKLLGDQNEDSQSSDISVPAKATVRRQRQDSPDLSPPRRKHNGSLDLSPPRRKRQDSPELSPPRRQRHDSLDLSPPRRKRHDSPDLSPPRRGGSNSAKPLPARRQRQDSPELSPPRRQRHDSLDLSPPRRKRHDSPDLSPPRRQRHDSPDLSPPRRDGNHSAKPLPARRQRHDSPDLRGASAKPSSHHKREATPDLSPPRRPRRDPDPETSPPRRRRSRSRSPGVRQQSRTKGASPATKKLRHDSESPPPRRGAPRGLSSPKRGALKRSPSRSPDSDLSPPRRTLPAGKEQHRSRSPHEPSPHQHHDPKASPRKSLGWALFAWQLQAGLVTADVLRREQQELRRQERSNQHLEEESRHSQTVFRDKSGRRRDLAQEQLQQRQRAAAEAERDALYAKWGKGLAQDRQQQQNVEDAIKEMQKPLARYIDDQDLDQMLREQEREGDPMADFIKKRKAKENKEKKEKPRYKGPAPPLNRFNIWPGHRWDGVDRSNGFEQQRFARMANRKAVQELAYKWSVEDM
ncbi:BUD13 [Dryobates pubescens]|uniref:BUD13 homolog n=1 Tax=Dryobates pubescens TaxID=118200 RepID=A0A093GZK2_DRYPU|nr:BUD13 [Dryobates pubescens]